MSAVPHGEPPTTAERTPRTDDDWLRLAVALAVQNVSDGGGPFGAVVVRGGTLLAEGQNRVTRDIDPTAHAEVNAIRTACHDLGEFSLAGATLYTSCEPCPLCLSAALWARIDRVVFAADRHDAAEGGFDDKTFYELFETDRSAWPVQIESRRTEDAFAPFASWISHSARTRY